MRAVNRTAQCVPVWVLAFCIASTALRASAQTRTIKIGPYVQSLGPNSVEIRAELDTPAALEVTLSGPAAPVTRSSAAATMHAVTIAGLEPRARYTYSVNARGTKIEGAFVTAPAETATEPFTALLYGDNRTDDAAHAQVVKEMTRTPSDFLLHTGDFLGDSRRQDEWDRFFGIESALLRDRCVFAAIGNHDLIDDGDAYKRYFGKFNWTMRWEFVRFWFVNAMDPSPTTWLLEDLGAHDAEPGVLWRVVVLHQGPYSSGPHGANDLIGPSSVDQWRSHGVDLVLAGHDHIYERGYARKLAYVVSGGGGAPPYPIDEVLKTSHKAEASRHFVELRFATGDIEVTAHRVDGATIEKRTLHKGQGWDEEIAGPKTPTGDSPKPAPAEKPPPTSSWIYAAAGGGVLVLLILALRRRYGSGRPS
jgi:hypothetical protein